MTYIYAVGRRKTASAQVRLFAGKGQSFINGKLASEYVHRADLFQSLYKPLALLGAKDLFYFESKVE